MAAVKIKLGRIPCDCCGHPVFLKENEAGTLTVGCEDCDVCMFAKKGTAAAARWRGKLPKAPAPAPEPAPAAKPTGKVPKAPDQPEKQTTVPPAKRQATPFDFLGGR